MTLNTLAHKNIQVSGNYMCSGSHGNEQQFESLFVNVTSSKQQSEQGEGGSNPADGNDKPAVIVDPSIGIILVVN